MKTLKLVRTSTFRLMLWYMSLLGVSVLLLFAYIYWATAGFMERQTKATISAEIVGLQERYRLMGVAGLVHVINERSLRDTSGDSLYLLTDWRFNRYAGNLDHWPKAELLEEGWVSFTLDPKDGEQRRTALGRHFLLTGNYHLLVGRDVSERLRIEKLIVDSLIYGLAMTILLGIIGGVVMSRGMLQRIDVINRASRAIMNGDLKLRIPLEGTNDEFDQLVKNLNDMLDQIERLMAGIKHVSDNIAHDLRTPINRLRSRLEVALIAKEHEESYRAAIEHAIEEIEEIIATFNALLRISRIEAGSRNEEDEELDLALLADEVAEFYEPLAEEKDIEIVVDPRQGAKVMGHRQLMSQALANLLDNAIKYSPPGGAIRLTIDVEDGAPVLIVGDSGPGIPEEDRGRVLERFQRLEGSRNTPGSGLGLSLVAAVAKYHNARLCLEDNEPGLRVVMTFDQKQAG